tara:strand:+ start:5573 stop:5941 length:369 start_codon:yes stop_codon:yes gene_type:complete
MRKVMTGLLILGSIALSGTVLAADEKWKDGVLFTAEKIASLEGHQAYKIIFGLNPGKCTGDIVSVSEWLKMREGTLIQTYPGTGDVKRVKGDEWYQPNGTKVKVCNRSNQKAVLVGVQFRLK